MLTVERDNHRKEQKPFCCTSEEGFNCLTTIGCFDTQTKIMRLHCIKWFEVDSSESVFAFSLLLHISVWAMLSASIDRYIKALLPCSTLCCNVQWAFVLVGLCLLMLFPLQFNWQVHSNSIFIVIIIKQTVCCSDWVCSQMFHNSASKRSIASERKRVEKE